MTTPADVLHFIDTHWQIAGNFAWLTELPGRAFRASLKRFPKAERPNITAERHRAFTGNTPDPGKYWMATCASLGLRLPDDFFAAEALCDGALVELQIVPDLERPGKLKISGAEPISEPTGMVA